MATFDNREPEEFLLFVQNFQMMLEASGGLSDSAKIQYLSTLLRGEALRQLDMLSIEVGSTITTHFNSIILGLSTYYFPINALSEQKRVVRHGMRKPRELKLRH